MRQIHKNDINTNKIRCGVASNLLNVCKSATCKTKYLQMQLIEHVFVKDGENADKFYGKGKNICKHNSLL